MKLELSQEKTFVTDLRTEGIHFLGFVVKAEKKRKTPDPQTWTENLVGKPLPDMERLKDKIQKIADEVRVIGESTERNVQAAQIQRVNSMIVGLAQYLQPSICSHALHVIDRRINNTALAVWKKRFPRHYNKYQIPMEKLCNHRIGMRDTKVKHLLFRLRENGLELLWRLLPIVSMKASHSTNA